jgi:hypothetical protein
MKANLEVKGQVQLEEEDITKVLRILALKQADNILDAVSKVVYERYKFTPIKIQKDDELTKIVAVIDEKLEEGAQLLGKELRHVNRESNAGFTRRWNGFYGAAKEIFDELKSKKKHSIGLMDFYTKLLDIDDVRTGGKLFVKPGPDGEMQQIELSRVKQYLSPSQLKKTPQVRGIKWDEKNQEFRF